MYYFETFTPSQYIPNLLPHKFLSLYVLLVLSLYVLLGGHGVVVGGHVVDKVFGASLMRLPKSLTIRLAKKLLEGKITALGGCFPLLPALTMVRMKLHWELIFKLFKTHEQLAYYSSG